MAGEEECGDDWIFQDFPRGARITVARWPWRMANNARTGSQGRDSHGACRTG